MSETKCKNVTYLVLGCPHSVTFFMFEGLVFKIKFDISSSIGRFHNGEEDLDGTLWDGLHVLGLAELDLVAPNVTHLVDEEDLLDVDATPLVHYVLYDLFAAQLVHC